MAAKKLEKKIEGTVVTINAVNGEKGQMDFDFTSLPQDIQAKLGPFGLGHKLGDSAAGKEGKDAEEAIIKVWEGLVAGDWSVRAPAAPKVSTKVIADNFSNLSQEEQNAAKAVLASLGIKIPGITADAAGE
jgi:hypothetical protein